jgi:hypothetical protein
LASKGEPASFSRYRNPMFPSTLPAALFVVTNEDCMIGADAVTVNGWLPLLDSLNQIARDVAASKNSARTVISGAVNVTISRFEVRK